jgi:Peptidase family M28
VRCRVGVPRALLLAHTTLTRWLGRLPHGSFLVPCVAAVAWLAYVTAQPFVAARPAERPPRPIDPSRLEADVRTISSRFAPRDARHPEVLHALAQWIAAEASAAGGRVETPPFHPTSYGLEGASYENVVASFGPSGEGGERLVVGAHYDTCGAMPGADDNASGVAGLLELARQLGATPTLPMRIDLVAFASEEPPFFGSRDMGSAHHAASLAAQGVRVRAMIGLEMIGYFTDAPDSQRYPSAVVALLYPSRGDFVAVVARDDEARIVRTMKGAMVASSPLPVRSMTAPVVVAGADLSDHRSYWNAGYPAVMITDTAFLRNTAYHTDGDRPERLDYAKMADVVRGVYASLFALAR